MDEIIHLNRIGEAITLCGIEMSRPEQFNLGSGHYSNFIKNSTGILTKGFRKKCSICFSSNEYQMMLLEEHGEEVDF
jgi:hypothetical protein